VYGFSRLVLHFLLGAAERGVRFSVITSECRPRNEGYDLFVNLSKKVPVKVVLDPAIGINLSIQSKCSICS
jgi:translation initiation factor 2B subunit (eIF-2B alpha/beta/delta family)